MDYLMYCITNLLLFDIPLLYYYINLILSITFCLFSGDIYFFWHFFYQIYFFVLRLTVSKLFCEDLLDTFVDLPSNLLPIKSPVASAFFELLFLKQF